MKMRIVIGMLTLGILFQPASRSAFAQNSPEATEAITAANCRVQIYDRLSQQQRIERQMLFGRERAEDMMLNSVRHDVDGNAWMKMSADVWRTASENRKNTSWNDAQIDAQTEWEGMNEWEPASERRNRIGAFAVKGVVTSEIIHEYLLQTYRGYQCRLAMVCEGVRASFLRQEAEGDGRLRIVTPGCQPLAVAPLDQCRFGNVDAKESADFRNIATGTDLTDIETECGDLAHQLAEKEATFLRIAVAYDAAYRSLLQFAGNFDRFLEGLRGDFLAPIEQALPLLSAFSRIPCFAAQCNE